MHAAPAIPLHLADALSPQGPVVGALRAASTVMQYQVLQGGLSLWGKPHEAGLFECFILSEKTALDEARSGLPADIQKEGHIYAR